jgi:alkanesulfonate monooxygenase SsuD/methylene tetrahydromethanopterin reductase-like flavin-dependent oxidoreductase (luciferase family)
MRFHLFDLVHWPHPEPCAGWRQLEVYRQHLAEWELAEQLGFEAIWLSEHHFTNYNLLPSPNLMLAALSQRTQRIRIGAMINAVNFHNPWRLAEEAAMLDILSQGRLWLGLGRASDVQEYDTFGQSLSEGRERLFEGVDLMVQAFTQESVTFNGRYTQLGPASLRPRPLQTPHPPIFLSAVTPDTFAYAGRHNFGVGSIFRSVEETARSFSVYQAARTEAGFAYDPDAFILFRHIYVGRTRASALEEARGPLLEFFRLFQNAVLPDPEHHVFRFEENFHFLTERFHFLFGGALSYDEMVERGIVIVGDADSVAEEIVRQRRAIGMNRLAGVFAFGNLPHQAVMASLTRFGEQVMPALREAD